MVVMAWHRRRLFWGVLLLFVGWLIGVAVLSQGQPRQVTLTWREPSYRVSADYLGVAIDAAMLTEGEWWANSDSPPRPLDFSDPGLRVWTTLLQPAWLRLGGTEADKLWLAETGDEPIGPHLNREQITEFLSFAQVVGAKPFITANAGPLTRVDNQWQPAQLQRLLSWLPQDYPGALEWGNEPGAYWLIFGRAHQIPFAQLADEYRDARQWTQRRSIPLAGPANAFWPEIGEPLKQVFGSSKDFLAAGAKPDIFTWHYYPTQSSRCGVKTEGADWDGLLDTETVAEFEKRSRIIQRWLTQYSPDSRQWLGETGPAQCGGKAKLTDRFGASLWWLTHLGIAAKTGNETVIRQSLVGGDYALLRYHQQYSPNPDFWASVLWQQNMGPVGVPVQGARGTLQAFAHCHARLPGTLSLVVINAGRQSVQITLPNAASLTFMDVTSLQLDSRFTFVERQLAETLNWNAQANLPWQAKAQWRALPGYSYRWVLIPNVPQCGD
jgi:heparanase 1